MYQLPDEFTVCKLLIESLNGLFVLLMCVKLKKNWHNTNRLVNENDLIIRNYFLSAQLIQIIFIKLKQLFISLSFPNGKLSLEQLINLSCLNQLDIHQAYYEENSLSNLPNLQSLCLFSFIRKDGYFRTDAEKN